MVLSDRVQLQTGPFKYYTDIGQYKYILLVTVLIKIQFTRKIQFAKQYLLRLFILLETTLPLVR